MVFFEQQTLQKLKPSYHQLINTIITGWSVNTKNIDLSLRIDLASSVYASFAVNIDNFEFIDFIIQKTRISYFIHNVQFYKYNINFKYYKMY